MSSNVLTSECWNWGGYVNGQGYGVAYHEGRNQPAHRVVYMSEVGPIPEDCVLHHMCENMACVNPDHLEPVNRAVHRARHTGISLEDIAEIRRLAYVPGVKAPEVAARYGLAESTVYQYWHGDHYSEVHDGGKVLPPLKRCEWCGIEFQPKRRHTRFCADHQATQTRKAAA